MLTILNNIHSNNQNKYKSMTKKTMMNKLNFQQEKKKEERQRGLLENINMNKN